MNRDSTTSANASLRRGARVSAAVMVPLWVAAALAMLSRGFRTFQVADMAHRPPLAWLGILLLLGLSAWLILEAFRSGRIYLTADGIGHGRDNSPLRWTDIAVAEYRAGWLRFRDHNGRSVTFNIMFASSAHDVLEAVQDRLPPGVRLRVY